MTEKDLIEGCIRENRECQQEIFSRYAGKMLAVCHRYSRHHMEAEDILQDAFIKVFDNLGKFQFKGSFEGWIRRIVINTALKHYDRKRFTHEQIGLEVTPDQHNDPTVYSHLQSEDLMRLIAALPEGYKLVFNLYAIEGYSHKEIAEMLGIQESTSRSQLVKARKMLQAQIQKMQKIAV
ncbi:MAG: sigma-70 family RNA polymerase sigma factor [Saprospiraceae bacterium]|nr:sigma-70 family RNA polymerase sigma factor [Saprospiraceae bacterium]